GTEMQVGDIVDYRKGYTGGKYAKTENAAFHEMEIVGFNSNGDALLVPVDAMEYTTFAGNKPKYHYYTREDFLNGSARKGGNVAANPSTMRGKDGGEIFTGDNPSDNFRGFGQDSTENNEGRTQRSLSYSDDPYSADGKIFSRG